MALPPMTLSRRPVGFSTVSMPMEPVTSKDMVLKRENVKRETSKCLRSTWKLANFYSGGGDRVKPAGGEALIAVKKAVDGVVLLDVAAFEVQMDDGAVKGDVLREWGVGQGGVGGEDVPLLFLGGFEDVGRECIRRQVELIEFVDLMFVPLKSLTDSARHGPVQKPLHRKNSSAIPPYSRRSTTFRRGNCNASSTS